METGKLKKFSAEARLNLMEGVRRKLRVLGFDDEGRVLKEPELVQGATLWGGEEYPEAFYHQWCALRDKLNSHGVREVVEEAAYTWFNRMMAIRILTKNELCEPILMTEGNASGYPLLLENARMGRVPQMDAQQRHRFEKLMEDDNLTYEQFALLLTVWCHDNPIINACFGSLHDFVELLLPENILRPDGFIALLNNTGFITEEDFKSAELIGWLYQFYISDRKDEVMKKQKYASDEIPAATQIFTPNWIVKYMVENTILPQVDAPDDILDNAKYLVKNPDATPVDKIDLEDLKVADFACGSGHILNECFDLLFALYREEAYSRKEAVEAIFTKNLLGIDIDLRAKQLAMFALLLKACQKDASFADAHCVPKVMTVPELDKEYFYVNGELDPKGYLHHFFLGSETHECSKELSEAIVTLKDADVLGSIIKFKLSPSTRRQLSETVDHWRRQSDLPHAIRIGLPVMDFILALTDSYDAVVMNPPYMSTSKDEVLKKYAVKNYPDSKADLFTVFMDVAIDRLRDGGRYGMINMQSWMFLSSFESLRKRIIEEQQIESLLHLGARTFDELSGEVVQNAAFVISKSVPSSKGIYYRLVDGKNCEDKCRMFLTDGNRSVVGQKQFEKIPGMPIAYWISEILLEAFKDRLIGNIAEPRVGMATADNDRFIRLWHEVSFNKIGIGFESRNSAKESHRKWFPFTKGGTFRNWYGNNEYVVNWENDGEEIRNFKDSKTGRIRSHNYNLDYIFTSGLTWGTIASGKPSFRFCPTGYLYSNSGYGMFFNEVSELKTALALLNSPIAESIINMLSPGIGIESGYIRKIPFLKTSTDCNATVESNIALSKSDWDAHETSWDFNENELIRMVKDFGGTTLAESVDWYQKEWESNFRQLHRNEEELNRIFIETYGLEDELNPHVDFEDVTILQQGEINLYRPTHGLDFFQNVEDAKRYGTVLEDEGLVIAHQSVLSWNNNVIIKQLISYIVGCYMGRYRLDKPGLAIAHPEPTAEELADYTFKITKEETFKIDPDAIIPVLPTDAPFYDNLYNYVSEFIRKVWGEETHTENMNFIDQCLGKSLNDYLMRDFWKDHKRMYQNRPIYWEFTSSKGAFRAIVYAHRMDRYTVEVLRSKYLLPYRNFIEQKIANLEARAADLSTAERRELDNLRKKTLPELIEYHDRVEQVAAEAAARPTVFDLDDGVPHNHALFGSIVTKLK